LNIYYSINYIISLKKSTDNRFYKPSPKQLLLIMKDLLINEKSFTRHWLSRPFFYGWLIHFLHPFMFMSPIAFHAFHSLSSHSLQVAAVATLSTLPQPRAMHKAKAGGRAGDSRERRAEATASVSLGRIALRSTPYHAASGSKASLGRCNVAMRPATGPTVPFSGECVLLRQN